MMKYGFIRLVVLIAGVLVSIIMPAQDLPLLPSDPAVKTGVFPDGLTCYVAANQSEKGFADIAVIDKSQSEGKETLVSLEKVCVANEAQTDSLLIKVMKFVEESAAPADMAVVICGDVDASRVMDKLRYMSYMVDGSIPSPVPEYQWKGDDSVATFHITDTVAGLATVSLQWEAPRTPGHFMNTVQFAVYRKSVAEIGIVAENRIRHTMQYVERIPVADVRWSHRSSLEGSGNESFRLEVTVADEHVGVADTVAHRILANMRDRKTRSWDLAVAQADYMFSLEREASVALKDNQQYVDMCRKSFLYNGPLSSEKEILGFHKSKEVPDSTAKRLFDNMTHALIKTDVTSDEVADVTVGFMLQDTIALPAPSAVKAKLKSSRKDHVSGGVVWTFANGFKVVYKSMPTDDVIYYSLALNGGYADIPGLAKGEGAFISDYLDYCSVSGGMSAHNVFDDLLKVAGMTLDTQVNLSNTLISGKVYDNNVGLLMKTLLAIANDRSPSPEEFGYYVSSENLRLRQHDDLHVALDSLLCPGYIYSSVKSKGNLSLSTAEKAEAFFAEQFSKMNDGVLILVGEMSEQEMRRSLQMYVSEFRTRDAAFRRANVQYQPVSGSSTYQVEAEEDAIVVAASVLLPLTVENYMACDLATMHMQRTFDQSLDDSLSVSVTAARKIYPRERFSVLIKVTDKEGGPLSTETLWQIRSVLDQLSEQNIDDAVLKAYKECLKHRIGISIKTPEYWVHAITLRHLEGKDFTTGYAAGVDAVTPDRLTGLISSLRNGSRIEYIMKTN